MARAPCRARRPKQLAPRQLTQQRFNGRQAPPLPPPPPQCFRMPYNTPHKLPRVFSESSRSRYPLRNKKRWTISQPRKSKSKRSRKIPASETFNFNLLPSEIQDMIWEIVAEEPRIVDVRVSHEHGPAKVRSLISTTPTILHICSRSRAIGLKYTSLSLGSRPGHTYKANGEIKKTFHSAAKIYFNLERDTLWFGPLWNQGVDGRCCCIVELESWIEADDLSRVKNIGFDLSSRICSTRGTGGHGVHFSGLDALKNIYLGLNLKFEAGKEIELRKMEGEEEKRIWMEAYEQQWKAWSTRFLYQNPTIWEDSEFGLWEKRWMTENGQIEKSFGKFEPMIVVS